MCKSKTGAKTKKFVSRSKAAQSGRRENRSGKIPRQNRAAEFAARQETGAAARLNN
jgi:hypothetical protein